MAWTLDGELFSEGAYSATFRGRTVPSTISGYFNRDSDGTDISKSGTLTTKGTNPLTWDTDTSAYDQPCFDGGDGLILEAAATNLLVNSVWAGAESGAPGTAPTSWSIYLTGSPTYTVADSSIYAGGKKITFTAENNRPFIYIAQSVTAQTYTLSALITVPQGNAVLFSQVIGYGAVPGGTTISARRANGVSIASGDVLPAGSYILELVVAVGGSGSFEARLGCGIVSATTGAITIENPQLEAGSFRTSYIPTDTAARTRAAAYIGNIPLADLGLVSKVNDYSFHVAVKMPFSSAVAPGFKAIFDVGPNTADTDGFRVQFSTTAGQMMLVERVNNSAQNTVLSGLSWAAGDVLNIRGRIENSNVKLYAGASSAASTTGVAATNFNVAPDSVRLGAQRGNTSSAGALAVLGFTLYDYALTDAELEELTVDVFDSMTAHAGATTPALWIQAETENMAVNDAWMQYLADQGYTEGSFNDRMYLWLAAQGYTGSLSDMQAAWSREYLVPNAEI